MMSKEMLIKTARLHSYKPENLEKVLRLLEILQQFSLVPFLKERLALKGGTALNLFHFEKIPRLSVDIDFNYIGSLDIAIMEQDRKNIENVIFKIMRENNFNAERSANRHAGGKTIWRYRSVLGQQGSLEIDLNYMYRTPLWPVQNMESKLTLENTVTTPVLDIHELAAGKLAALFARNASRDLFDAHYLLKNCAFNEEKLRLSIVVYLANTEVALSNMSPHVIEYSLKDLHNKLLPLLHQEKIPKSKSDVKEFCENLLSELRELLSKIFPLEPNEIEFIEKIRNDRKIMPDLITRDEKLMSIINSHPALLWQTKKDKSSLRMIKKSRDAEKNNPKIENLFVEPGSDKMYEVFRTDKYPYCQPAKHYWQTLYEKHHASLDENFASSLRQDTYSRLWELTLVEFLAQYQSRGLTPIKMSGKNISKPDFCFTVQNDKFYLEATCAGPGEAEALNEPAVHLKVKSTPIAENMERFCSAIDEKGNKKYQKYKKSMDENSGLILAISMAKIPFQNQTLNYENELRCLFGMSPLTFQIIHDSTGKGSMGNPHYTEQKNFEKVTKKTKEATPIKMDYFSSEEYSHISAVLISYTEMVFFPGFDQYFPISWRHCENDYVLVHNRFAKIKLPIGFFSVLREVTEEIVNEGKVIKVIDKTQDR